MSLPIALQPHTLREEIKSKGGEHVIRWVAEANYAGLEGAGGLPVSESRALLDELGLEVPSMHGALPLGDDKEKVLDDMATLRTKRLIVSRGKESLETEDAVRAVCDELNTAGVNAAERGFQVGYHNHYWEYNSVVNGKPVWQLMHELLAPDVFMQLDTYWAAVGGVDPVEALTHLGDRVQSLHIKDGPASKLDNTLDMVAVGAGELDFASIIAAATNADYLIVELDRCATDMYAAAAESITYLVGEGLGHGRSGK